MATAPSLRVDEDFDSIRIFFGDCLHAHVRKDKLLGVTSWRYGKHNFTIEYVLVGGVITTEYDNADNWKFILKRLDEIL